VTAQAPPIVTRSQWGANPAVTPAGPISTPSPELWLHHTAGEQFGAAGMRMLQQFTLHRPDAHYVDLEYTFVVDHASLQIFESRGPGRNTAATGGHNDRSHAICVMGNFETDPVTPALINVLANLVAYGYEQRWWPLGFTGGHRDASGNSTACPGDHLEAVIPIINATAAHIHAGGTPMPPTPVAHARYNPPVSVIGGIAASLPLGGGELVIGPLGHLYAFDGAPNLGGPIDAKTGQPKPYWVGHQVKDLVLPSDADRHKQPSVKYVVIDQHDARFMYPEVK
jgi:hypothetical protein